MKTLQGLYLLLLIAIMLSGCVSRDLTIKPTSTVNQPPSPMSIPLTPTPTASPMPSVTLTPPATMEPEQAKDTISTLLREPVDCPAPCFWGIMPGKTTVGEAKSIFTHLGLQVWHNVLDNKEFYGVDYKFDGGLSVSSALTIQNDVVKNLTVNINPEKQKVGVPRKWLAYSPETLIKQYGPPSKVAFEVGRGAPDISYGMVIYFDTVDLIIEYGGYDVTFEKTSFRVCPLTDQSDGVRVWLGKNPENPPLEWIPLEKATSMTMDKFAKLMTGTPDKACLNLKQEMFP